VRIPHILSIALIAIFGTASPSLGQCQTACQARVTTIPPQAVRQPQRTWTYATQTTTVTYAVPTDLVGRLNAIRASYGLSALGYDANLAAECGQNNAWQRNRGLGHHFMGRARRQNAAYGVSDSGSVINMWMASPGHASALLDPTVRMVGYHFDGYYWTWSAY
jgi:uncharacterized protein YkwD